MGDCDTTIKWGTGGQGDYQLGRTGKYLFAPSFYIPSRLLKITCFSHAGLDNNIWRDVKTANEVGVWTRRRGNEVDEVYVDEANEANSGG
jgi:hypothetical protein